MHTILCGIELMNESQFPIKYKLRFVALIWGMMVVRSLSPHYSVCIQKQEVDLVQNTRGLTNMCYLKTLNWYSHLEIVNAHVYFVDLTFNSSSYNFQLDQKTQSLISHNTSNRIKAVPVKITYTGDACQTTVDLVVVRKTSQSTRDAAEPTAVKKTFKSL